MEGNFNDGKNCIANVAGGTVFIVGFIATVIISVSMGDFGVVFQLPGISLTVLLMVVVINLLANGKFSADEKFVAFSVGFRKYEYSYKNIINVKTETTFTNGRYGKILHIEIMLSLRNGKIVRFYDTVSQYEYDTMEDLKKLQEKHQFTELAEYIKSRL